MQGGRDEAGRKEERESPLEGSSVADCFAAFIKPAEEDECL